MLENYILIFFILTILIVFYGGQNKLDKIKYNSKIFDYTKNLNLLKDKLIYYKNTSSSNYIDITNNLNTCNYLLPNLIFSYCIKINPNSIFDVNDLINNDKYEQDFKILMILYTINSDYKDLFIIIDKINNEYIMVEVDENIFITNSYNIYNKSNKIITLFLLFIKKPLWY
jgi:hypothetical protein